MNGTNATWISPHWSTQLDSTVSMIWGMASCSLAAAVLIRRWNGLILRAELTSLVVTTSVFTLTHGALGLPHRQLRRIWRGYLALCQSAQLLRSVSEDAARLSFTFVLLHLVWSLWRHSGPQLLPGRPRHQLLSILVSVGFCGLANFWLIFGSDNRRLFCYVDIYWRPIIAHLALGRLVIFGFLVWMVNVIALGAFWYEISLQRSTPVPSETHELSAISDAIIPLRPAMSTSTVNSTSVSGTGLASLKRHLIQFGVVQSLYTSTMLCGIMAEGTNISLAIYTGTPATGDDLGRVIRYVGTVWTAVWTTAPLTVALPLFRSE